MDDALCELRGKGVHISDRKYFGYAPLAQAKAWLEGRDAVALADLLILRHYLWTLPEERAVVESTLERMCSDPMKEQLDGILQAAQETYQDFEDASAAPPARRIGKLRDEFLVLYQQLDALSAQAQSEDEGRQISACLDALEVYSRQAHADTAFSYAPLSELYALKAG